MKTRTRTGIRTEIEVKKELIKQLEDEIVDLIHEDYLLNDDEQWYTEKEESIYINNPTSTEMVGRINWTQKVRDEDSGKLFDINRSSIVKVGSKWV